VCVIIIDEVCSRRYDVFRVDVPIRICRLSWVAGLAEERGERNGEELLCT
jgi:hypothetical protein